MLYNFIETTLQHVCSPVNVLHIFRTPLPRSISGGLFLSFLRNTVFSMIRSGHMLN